MEWCESAVLIIACAHLFLNASSVQFSRSVLSDSLRPRGLQHSRLSCPSLTPGAYSNSCPSSWWCHPTTSSSIVPFSSCLQSFPASGSFPVSQFFTSCGQSIWVSASASVHPMNIQDRFPLLLTTKALLILGGYVFKITFSSFRVWRRGEESFQGWTTSQLLETLQSL